METKFRINNYKKVSTYTSYRKIALGTWRNAYDPSTYSWFEIEVDEAKKFISEINQTSGLSVRLSHLLSQAISLVIHTHPDLNIILRGNSLYQRIHIDIFHHIIFAKRTKGEMEAPDLTGGVVRQTEKLSLVEHVKQYNSMVEETRNGKSESIKAQKNIIRRLPNSLMFIFLKLSSFLIYRLNVKIPFLGLSEDPFGSVIFSDNSSIKAPNSFMPLVPYSRVGFCVCMGKSYKKPLVVGDQVVIREVLPISLTFDHRLTEGYQMALLHRDLLKFFKNPRKYLLHSPEETLRKFSGMNSDVS